MNRRLDIIILFLGLFIGSTTSWSQQKHIDTLIQKPYEFFEKYFETTAVDTIASRRLANAYLTKATQNQDIIKKANAFFYLSETYPPEEALPYVDSIIENTKRIKDHSDYPALGYLQKGILQYRLGAFKKAVSSYYTALEFAEERNNMTQILALKGNIGILKLSLGEKKEALEISKNYVTFLNQNNITAKENYQKSAYLTLVNAYMANGLYDSADIYLDKGLKVSRKLKDSLSIANYLITRGMNNFHQKRFQISIKDLLIGQGQTSVENLKGFSNLYLGKSYLAINDTLKAIQYFENVDLFLSNSKNVIPDFIEAYNPLIHYYRKNKKLEKQVYYMQRLIYHDSVLASNQKFLLRSISKNYDLPQLIREKDVLVTKLRQENYSSKKYLHLVLIICSLFVFIILFIIRRNVSLRKKFNDIIQQTETNESSKIGAENLDPTQTKKDSIDSIGLPKELVTKVLTKLDDFETKNKFTRKKYTLNNLAKEMGTNTTYLSKIINATKGVNFSNYLNELKIQYAIKTLKEDRSMRSYTIDAIAKEVGFNTAQSFSVAFHKRTGIHPSYFIKRLNKTS